MDAPADEFEEPLLSSTVDVELDDSTGQLSSRTPIEVTNEPGGQRVLSEQMRNWGLRGDITCLRHGTYDGNPATIIGFEFRFMFSDARSRSRISGSTITVTFEPGSGTRYPEVQGFAPLRIEGPVTQGEHTKGVEVWTGVSAPLPAKPEVGVGWSNEVKYLRGYKMSINGRRWNEGTEVDNQVQWTLQENSREGDGIPQCFNSAIMIAHDGKPLKATVVVKAKTKSGLPVLGRPWSKPRPLMLSPTVSLGAAPIAADFEKLEDGDWSKLAKYDGEVKKVRWNRPLRTAA